MDFPLLDIDKEDTQEAPVLVEPTPSIVVEVEKYTGLDALLFTRADLIAAIETVGLTGAKSRDNMNKAVYISNKFSINPQKLVEIIQQEQLNASL